VICHTGRFSPRSRLSTKQEDFVGLVFIFDIFFVAYQVWDHKLLASRADDIENGRGELRMKVPVLLI
jgi:hypothetical protein